MSVGVTTKNKQNK